MNSYVLIVDDETDILEIHEMTVRSSFDGEVLTALSGNEALRIIREKGIPRLIISDYQMDDGDGLFLYNSLKESSIQVPFIVCSANPFVELKSTSGNVHIVSKPNIVTPMIEILKSILDKTPNTKFVPVRMSHIIRVGGTQHDLYLRLGEGKFVKAFNKGEPVSQADSERYINKSIHNLYISTQDAQDFIQNFEKYIHDKNLSFTNSAEDLEIAAEAIESVEALSRALGWAPECVEISKKTVDLALRYLESEVEVIEILRLKFNIQSRYYSGHISKLALMSAALCGQVGTKSPSGQLKLALASLLHDVTVDPDYYQDINLWNTRAADPMDCGPETLKYRYHPLEAGKLVAKMKNLPPDVDKIIMDHHENASMSGFPRKIIASRISHLTAIFIITEDLISFLGDKLPTRNLLESFIQERETKYAVGRFKNIFSTLKDSLLR